MPKAKEPVAEGDETDLDQERIERTYKDLHGAQYYLGYIALSCLFAVLLDLRAVLETAKVVKSNQSAIIDIAEVLLIAGVCFEVGWVARMGQIENLAKVKHMQFFADIAVCLISIIFFLAGALSTGAVSSVLDIIWLTPSVLRAIYLGIKSQKLMKEAAAAAEGKANSAAPAKSSKIGLPSVPIGKMATSLMMSKLRG